MLVRILLWMGKVARYMAPLGGLIFIALGGYIVLVYIYNTNDGSNRVMVIMGGIFLAMGFIMFWRGLKEVFPR